MNNEANKERFRKLTQGGFTFKVETVPDSSTGGVYDFVQGFMRNEILHGFLDPSVCRAVGESWTKEIVAQVWEYAKTASKEESTVTAELQPSPLSPEELLPVEESEVHVSDDGESTLSGEAPESVKKGPVDLEVGNLIDVDLDEGKVVAPAIATPESDAKLPKSVTDKWDNGKNKNKNK